MSNKPTAAEIAYFLDEDIGRGDITAQIISEATQAQAIVIAREEMVLCGQAWFDAVFQSINSDITIHWLVAEGVVCEPNTQLCTLQGSARGLLTGERTALNFLQLLSGTATICRKYADLVEGTGVKLLDTRKTIPGLRTAQKYAVTQGGCFNHRVGLYDAFLIKENHIMACGGIGAAVSSAKLQAPMKNVEIEVESIGELGEAIDAGADIVMLDNFNQHALEAAVSLNKKRTKLEASGNITTHTISTIAKTGIDYISIGALTKSCTAIDLSMRF